VRVGVFLVVMSVVVSMIMAAGGGVMGMIVTAGRVIMVVIVIVVVGNRMIVSVIVVVVVMPATATVGMSVVVVMTVIVIVTAVEFGGVASEQVEEAQDHEADTGDQDHGLEDAIGWEVIDDAARGVEVKQHAAPKEKQGDADVMSEGAGEVHGLGVLGERISSGKRVFA
jgi:hypothetical protein